MEIIIVNCKKGKNPGSLVKVLKINTASYLYPVQKIVTQKDTDRRTHDEKGIVYYFKFFENGVVFFGLYIV
jgi:hypothetical protein